MKKRILAAMLAASMGLLSACSSGTPDASSAAPDASAAPAESSSPAADAGNGVVNLTGYPIVNEPITLRYMATRSASYQNGYADMQMFKDYETETNIHIEWEEVPEEGWTEKVKLTLAAGSNLPDVFYGATIDGATIFKYGQQGIIPPINDLLEQYAPNATKYMNERPEIRKMMTMTDGNIYSIPSIDESLSTRCQEMMIVNQTWLDRVGLEQPKTVDEFYNMLKTFKEKDGNGNGVIGDEICMSLRQYTTPNNVDHQRGLINFFGFFGVVDDNSHVMIKDNKVIFVPTTDEYREAVTFFNKLYNEGLFDQETFTQNDSQLWSKTRSPEGVGMTAAFSWLELNDGNVEQNNYQLMAPLEGQVVATNVVVAGCSVNRFTITKDCQYPEAAIRWIDTFLDNGERALESRFGKEGETWKWLDEGKEQFTEMAESPDGNKVDTAYISQFGPGYLSVQWELQDLWRKKLNTIQQFIDRAKMCNEVYINSAVTTWPGLGFDEETNKDFTNIDTDLRKYTDNMLSKFILEGVTDEAWNEYIDRCKALRSEELVAIYQKRWDAFQA